MRAAAVLDCGSRVARIGDRPRELDLRLADPMQEGERALL
jgi:hypothetical protein